MESSQTVSKFKIAVEHLETAIKLFFEGGKETPIHTLTQAAHEVLDTLCAHKGLDRSVVHAGVSSFIKPEHQKMVRDKIYEAKNYFKHADRDPDGSLKWNPSATPIFLWDASVMYRRLIAINEPMSPEVIAFSLWFRAQNSELWKPEQNADSLVQKIMELSSVSKESYYHSFLIALKQFGSPLEEYTKILRL